MAEKEELGENLDKVRGIVKFYRNNKETIWKIVAIIGTLTGFTAGGGIDGIDVRGLVPDSVNVVKLQDRVTELETNVKLTNEIVKKLADKVD